MTPLRNFYIQNFLYTKALRTTLDGSKKSKDRSWGDPGILKMGPTAKSGLPRTRKIYNFGHEWGRRGSPRGHTLAKRRHGLQEGF